ncbi:unnamed protein product [Cylicocyclus nassatus]|uniref:DUF4376 domain-containing protein n=1 Tax=Cylicocyclus nassatus TaxID=53992 RepID=A0AA36MIW8_CYLNA|nr:unnamed protein product [Cylicocyclus nassatus]
MAEVNNLIVNGPSRLVGPVSGDINVDGDILLNGIGGYNGNPKVAFIGLSGLKGQLAPFKYMSFTEFESSVRGGDFIRNVVANYSGVVVKLDKKGSGEGGRYVEFYPENLFRGDGIRRNNFHMIFDGVSGNPSAHSFVLSFNGWEQCGFLGNIIVAGSDECIAQSEEYEEDFSIHLPSHNITEINIIPVVTDFSYGYGVWGNNWYINVNTYDNVIVSPCTTWEDYLNGLYVPLSEEQKQFHFDYPDATPKEVWNLALDYIPGDSDSDYEPEPNPRTIAQAKVEMRNRINRYDTSKYVNAFYIGKDLVWLDKETRVGLSLRFNAETQLGKEITTLWYNGKSYTIPLSVAPSMLYQIEDYASKCYDNTQKHLAEIKALNSVEEIDNFDYKAGYPEKLHFEI